MNQSPKVFISYSWTTPIHEEWVINLGERLRADGVDAILDKWDLKEGQDKYSFMESMVTSPEITKVLVVLDKKYCEKADERSGGVGTETQIISPQIYSNVAQEKFIPLLTENDEEGQPYIPTFFNGKIYIDFSSQDFFEKSYDQLLRNIFGKPEYTKPKLGAPPSYIFEESVTIQKTGSIVRGFDYLYEKNPKKINSIVKEFFSEFLTSLEGYEIDFQTQDSDEIGKLIMDNLNSYLPLRNDYISFINKITRPEVNFDIGLMIKFLEDLQIFKWPLKGKTSWTDYHVANFKFIIHELFLYIIAILKNNENYDLMEELFYSSYIIGGFERNQEPKRFDYFFNGVTSFDSYYNRTHSSRPLINPMADFLLKRIPAGFDKKAIVEADLLCFYLSIINNLHWFPLTYIYDKAGNFDFFTRLISQRHFIKVKSIFHVQSVQELKEKLSTINVNDLGGYSNSFDRIPLIKRWVDIEKIGSVR